MKKQPWIIASDAQFGKYRGSVKFFGWNVTVFANCMTMTWINASSHRDVSRVLSSLLRVYDCYAFSQLTHSTHNHIQQTRQGGLLCSTLHMLTHLPSFPESQSCFHRLIINSSTHLFVLLLLNFKAS